MIRRRRGKTATARRACLDRRRATHDLTSASNRTGSPAFAGSSRSGPIKGRGDGDGRPGTEIFGNQCSGNAILIRAHHVKTSRCQSCAWTWIMLDLAPPHGEISKPSSNAPRSQSRRGRPTRSLPASHWPTTQRQDLRHGASARSATRSTVWRCCFFRFGRSAILARSFGFFTG